MTNIGQEYPNKLDHVLNHAGDLRSPRALHPIFYGSYDWHSAVHMHWLLVRLLRGFPDLPQAAAISALLSEQFSAAHVSAEIAYLNQPSRDTFERTYGWAWLLQLQAELATLARQRPDAAGWHVTLQPLADCFVQRYLAYLPRARYPIRAGTHANSAFGLLLARRYALHCETPELLAAIDQRAVAWFANDRCYPCDYEPGGDDFLSGGLVQAALMHDVLGDDFAAWWQQFCPTSSALQRWLEPAAVGDRTDAKHVHLDGLNLSRAWCWSLLREALPTSLRAQVDPAIAQHLQSALPQASDGDYVGTHWLASFATLALYAYQGET
ncbi:MAG: DUF2891 domain-containing protein [Pseudomonadota bacterium]|nr:DUF2891 domain-containing protein [Pseudomonadota bacterium]